MLIVNQQVDQINVCYTEEMTTPVLLLVKMNIKEQMFTSRFCIIVHHVRHCAKTQSTFQNKINAYYGSTDLNDHTNVNIGVVQKTLTKLLLLQELQLLIPLTM